LFAAQVSAAPYPERGFAAALFEWPSAEAASNARDKLALLQAKLSRAYVLVGRFESLAAENAGLTALIDSRLGACAALATARGAILWSSESARALMGEEGEAQLEKRVRESVKAMTTSAQPTKVMLQLPGRRRIYAGLSFIRESANASVQYVGIELYGAEVESGDDKYRLTAAERETYDLLIEGASYAEIAKKRHVSIDTVRSQIKAIFAKAGVTSRFELVTQRLKGPLREP
jgi:DNA-binding CsgD family transcriptional regulator